MLPHPFEGRQHELILLSGVPWVSEMALLNFRVSKFLPLVLLIIVLLIRRRVRSVDSMILRGENGNNFSEKNRSQCHFV